MSSAALFPCTACGLPARRQDEPPKPPCAACRCWRWPFCYGLRLPASPAAFLLFLASLLLGLVIVCALCMLIYGLTFYTMSPSGLRMFATSAVSIFSGELIPLSFLPEGLRQAAELLPFAGIQDFPLRIWNGLFPVEEAAAPLALQLFWAAVLTAAGALLFRRALRRVVVQGG